MLGGLLYQLYQNRVRSQIDPANTPKHVAVIVDGNRRWAKLRLAEAAAAGHRAGAQKIPEFLKWCESANVATVTLYLLSTDNLTGRASEELQDLFLIIAELAKTLAGNKNWRVKHVGDVSLLPVELTAALQDAERANPHATGLHVNLAVGYGGRSEITAAVHAAVQRYRERGGELDDLASWLTPERIGEHLWTGGQADPELIIRTSGEQRLSDFMIWQAAHSEFYFVEALYPDLREVDLLRALRDFSRRRRRFGA
ncbi:di-trans,poly-cis-decaprenylcistransferase [Canibacter sp. lx-72]|uniref:polyprenyl diphosphate synthase n=1 Tax=Canibacter zhuwentaonis TaxID=2837491 RepID=UPI001BDC5C1F|nr:polyprenyl diphosphate synthase [Canibacter zhuwentaonis]MBT1018388.1 di-trans,poly-cis-decaprenylcistransferase [Canibacter zhuwentaonis]MBT1035577.1 di-trans,poly-cis-decaprenylcistransferase [Canibacter zhuwentaonis]